MRKFYVLLLLALTACNTMQGIGRDIEAGGEAVNDAATTTKNKMSR